MVSICGIASRNVFIYLYTFFAGGLRGKIVLPVNRSVTKRLFKTQLLRKNSLIVDIQKIALGSNKIFYVSNTA